MLRFILGKEQLPVHPCAPSGVQTSASRRFALRARVGTWRQTLDGVARIRIGICGGLRFSKIRTHPLLALVLAALVGFGSDGALGQNAGIAAQAPLYTAIDLHPNGFFRSGASSVSGGEQVGVGYTVGDHPHAVLWRGSASSVVDFFSTHGVEATATCRGQQVGYGDWLGGTGAEWHALLWRGTAASVIDLHPSGFTDSEAYGTSGREQVGSGSPPKGGEHALLWRGSAASVVDLHPPHGFEISEAHGTFGGEQVGFGYGAATGGASHALLWRGTADSMVDLHPRGFSDSYALATSGGEQVGRGRIIASSTPGGSTFRALLWRGTADSVVDLNPRGVTRSSAQGTNGEEQVGDGDGHALLWHGSAASVLDLSTFLPPGFKISSASSIDAAGNIVGAASITHDSPSHAFLWKRNVLQPGTSPQQNTPRC